MSDRFDKFTERARKVLQLAQEEAQRFNHNYIGTEHLLLGLLSEGTGMAVQVLEGMGVSLENAREEVLTMLAGPSNYSGSAQGKETGAVGSLALTQIKTMFDYSLWARDRMLGAVRTLEDTDLTEGEHKGVYGSIHDTLAHMAVSEWLWIRRCLGESPMKLPKGADFADLDALVDWWDEVHADAMSYISDHKFSILDSEITYTAPDGKTRTRKVWHMLLQIPNHQTEHRAQIGTMLGQMGMEVPPTDLVVYLSELG